MCVCVLHTHVTEVTYELSCNCPWGRKTSGSASWGPRGFTWAKMSRMERQGFSSEPPQGWAPAEGLAWGEPLGPPLNVEEETELQGWPEGLDMLPQG